MNADRESCAVQIYGKMSLKCDMASSNESRGSGPFTEVARLKVGGRTVVAKILVQRKVPLRN